MPPAEGGVQEESTGPAQRHAECPRCGGSKMRTYAVEGYDGDREMEMHCTDCVGQGNTCGGIRGGKRQVAHGLGPDQLLSGRSLALALPPGKRFPNLLLQLLDGEGLFEERPGCTLDRLQDLGLRIAGGEEDRELGPMLAQP